MAALQDLFSKSNAQFSSANTSLRYQDKSLDVLKTIATAEETVSTNSNGGPVVASVVILYRYQNSNPIDLGKKAAAIVPNKDNDSQFCLICYEIKNRDLLLSITIHKTFILNVLSNNFISFYDSKCNYFALRLPNHDLLEQFVTAIVMSKVPKIIPFNSNRNIIIQELHESQPQSHTLSTSHTSVVCDLQIWLCDIPRHPYKPGPIAFNAQKTISLNNKILPALSLALHTKQNVTINTKKLIICSSHYGFGQKGNKTLNIPPNASLIIKCTVKAFVDSVSEDSADDSTGLPASPSAASSSTKQRIARISAATGGTLLAHLLHTEVEPPPAISSHLPDEHQANATRTPPPQQQTIVRRTSDMFSSPDPIPSSRRTPPPMQQPKQEAQESKPRDWNAHEDKLNDIWLELSNLRSVFVSPSPTSNVSCGDIIKCLSELNADLSQSKAETNAQKVEIGALKEEIETLKSRNHELLEKNNRLMEAQYESMSSTHDEALRLRKENIECENSIALFKQNNDRLQAENESIKQKLNDWRTIQQNSDRLQSENESIQQRFNECEIELRTKEERITQCRKECEVKQNEINALGLKLKESSALEQEHTRLTANYESICMELRQSKSESTQILTQSKRRIENLKKKFEMHQVDLIKRIMEFVYTKYHHNIKGNEHKFNYISFFRAITKQILANPNDFDEEEEDEEDDDDAANAEELTHS
eukprot:193026_1